MVLTPWRSHCPITEPWKPWKVQKVIAMKDQGWHRRDMMVTAGAQCNHLLVRRCDSLTAVQQATGCCILVLTEVQQTGTGAAPVASGYSLGEVPVVIMGPSLDAMNQVTPRAVEPEHGECVHASLHVHGPEIALRPSSARSSQTAASGRRAQGGHGGWPQGGHGARQGGGGGGAQPGRGEGGGSWPQGASRPWEGGGGWLKGVRLSAVHLQQSGHGRHEGDGPGGGGGGGGQHCGGGSSQQSGHGRQIRAPICTSVDVTGVTTLPLQTTHIGQACAQSAWGDAFVQ